MFDAIVAYDIHRLQMTLITDLCCQARPRARPLSNKPNLRRNTNKKHGWLQSYKTILTITYMYPPPF